MRILFIGDVMGNAGQEMVDEYLPKLKQRFHPQATIVNAENATKGRGINEQVYKRILAAGADVITMGNHVWDNPEIETFIGSAKKMLRPANFPAGKVPGIGHTIIQINQQKLAVINLQGRVFMNPSDDPFAVAAELIAALKKKTSCIFVDFHAETTSEKEAFSWYFDGQISAVVGTHTHVQTNDARILPQGTAFLADVGMTGPYDGILGMRRKNVISRFLNQMPTRFEVDEGGRKTLSCCVIDIAADTGKARKITPLQINADHPFDE
ncbi:TIGR00282 family metallophosphoesterase [Liquorilactobacillus satsumensis]|uniref:Metallophosphoesterase n=1 Tax=Liquorilactobacillus satsumensis DSM 16230 = JCM 12392 TaxID=1423801 RepID=A0A0R1V3Y6_9LACO|nr:TIGR00282 family metallophosphoesterase [Liquorilactobacillus satsumensis]KRL97525.1 metallophosphoesterase [Liquorilactobacillus satsumensis DSM 16230 = JCM 12392]MCC7666709.1 TIGR00282 family metallophosphoesterase [Liquorilactobacillus satsumensis]MCP9312672.1 TIGR00282 family metallophosphoesterase [Liquorilactobacillus satsumensis]MCP9327549.1 TIGR00282 family metallophosphoesterase [Liquorilactobacillus satsumensis]MCP9357585.1 TIGR00282 family metallophosphoesterase [Liquorilactobaci